MSTNGTNSSVAPLFYLAALNSAENVGMLIAQLITVLLMGFLLSLWICSHKSLKKMSPSIVFFLAGHALGNATTLPYTFQRLFWFWDPANWLYCTFWLTVLYDNYQSISSYFGLYLTVDRLLVLMLPYGIHGIHWPKILLQTIRRAFLIFAILLLLPLYVWFSLLYMQAFPLDPKTTLGPVPTAIIVIKSSNGGLTFQSTMKPIFGGMNMVAALFFLWKMRQTNMKNMKDRLVKFTVWAELLMDILPYAINQGYRMITNQSIADYTGSLRTLLSYMDPAVCAIYYTAMFIKWGEKVHVFASTIRSKKQQQQQLQLQLGQQNLSSCSNKNNNNNCNNNYNNNGIGMNQLTVATRFGLPHMQSSMPNMPITIEHCHQTNN